MSYEYCYISEKEVRESLSVLSPKFALGFSHCYQMDCLGWVVYYLKQLGFKVSWEDIIDRRLTDYHTFLKLMKAVGFTQVTSLDLDIPLIVAWQASYTVGHLGIFTQSDKVTHHMTPWGLRSEQVNPLHLSYYTYNEN